jgi:hypothetical protein
VQCLKNPSVASQGAPCSTSQLQAVLQELQGICEGLRPVPSGVRQRVQHLLIWQLLCVTGLHWLADGGLCRQQPQICWMCSASSG